MLTTTLPAARPARETGVRRPSPIAIRRIVLATAGASSARGALLATHALASRHGAQVSVVSVFQPRIPYPALREGESSRIPQEDRDPARRQLAVVRQHLATLGADTGEWSLSLVSGQPAHNIHRLAKTHHADLTVIGLGREDAAERGLGDRGSMAIAGTVHSPLLAVAANSAGTFREVMVAVGIDDSAVAAFRVAQALLPPPARLHLVHVAEATAEGSERASRQRIDGIRASLTTWSSADLECWSLTGDPIDQLLAFGQRHSVDLVVGGLHGRSFAERAIMRNAALWLMAIGDRSVLLVPTSEGAL